MSAAAVVIAGAGLSGFQVASALREMGYQDRVVLIGDEPVGPYHRPPLSKGYLLGTVDEAKLAMRPAAFYRDRNIELISGRKVVALDRSHRRAGLDDDSVVEYSHFVFAVGARNRPLPVPGTDLDGVFFLRTLGESQVLRQRLSIIRRAVVIGAGFIGLEFASAASKLGIEVTVIDVANRPMARAVSEPISAIFTREHAASGVSFKFNSQVMRIVGDDAGRAVGVETVDGDVIAGELVLIGIGVQPNIEVAAACGLEIGNGIAVNELLLTQDPGVSAVGDCAAHPNPFAKSASIRLESVQNATDQARCVAARLTGSAHPYSSTPWFWSDQGRLKLQIAGLTTGYDQAVVRGDPTGNSCAVFCFGQGSLLGVETVNRPADHMTARRLLAQRVPVTVEQAGDEGADLRQLLAAAA